MFTNVYPMVTRGVDMGFKVKKKPLTTEDRFKYLIENISYFKSQNFIDAVFNMSGYYKRAKYLSPEQLNYLDFLYQRMKDIRGRDDD